MNQRILTWPREVKQLIVLAMDVLLALASTWLAFGLRLDVWARPVGAQWWVYLVAPALAIPIFVRFGLYRAIFRYTGQAALNATAKAVLLYSVLLTAVLLWNHWVGVPRTLGVLQPLIFLILVGLSRAMARFWLAGLPLLGSGHTGKLLIYGAGTAGAQTASALQVSGQLKLIGFVDDDANMVGRSINGKPIFAADALLSLVSRHAITDILLAMPSATRERRNQIIQSLESLPVHVRSLPSLSDLTSGKVTVQDFRELDIEDLLGREPVPPRTDLLARDLAGQVVLVSGAGGSIGSELTRQIVQQKPRQLLLLDHSEFGLYSIHQELQAQCITEGLVVGLVPLLASVSNPERLQAVFNAYRPATVYHAAAYKHVPMVEDNPGEGVRNNVFGTLHMAQAAVNAGVHRFVLISTDKAVRPTNVMGATKRMAELVLQAFAQAHPHTLFSMVRFGNVLGSSGSVVPLFRKQLASGGPLTVTDAEVTRYFMTIPEAAQLVLQAGAMGQGGDVFVLDMGQPIKIIDLARRMLHLSGLSERTPSYPQGDIEIAITGLRPGEKLYEELLIGDNPEPTEHPRIMKAREPFLPWAELRGELQGLQVAADQNDAPAIKAVFLRHVQGYQPT
ncbi:polysaccharide biosynthesis protein [Rhodoferax lacus]|uniref:Polysaccharide biosynthesis protein n=1 Tax=Rhodoferax lacus TaxID=2184758 RepID=A0A3E1R993_9BURK|nr:nucleoside-diphosphate sugar epimerase/dehydratase [Rhodoferax lacus]RFO95934.1 polysaccharide biosynthesis protein [Rhodoferax lacus]